MSSKTLCKNRHYSKYIFASLVIQRAVSSEFPTNILRFTSSLSIIYIYIQSIEYSTTFVAIQAGFDIQLWKSLT